MSDLDRSLQAELRKEQAKYLAHLESRLAVISGDVLSSVRRRRKVGRIRAISVAAAVVVVAVGVSNVEWERTEPPAAGEGLLLEPLPEPPRSLLNVLPNDVDHVVRPGLVLLYREGENYVAYSEGVFPHSCPLAGKRCFSTATKTIFESDIESVSGSGVRRVPEPPEGTEVLWSAVPASGFIGAEAPDACSRIERFVPYFACVDDTIRETEPEEVALPAVGGTASIPKDWLYNPSVQFNHLTVDLITSNNPKLLKGAVSGSTTVRVRKIDAEEADPADVFLEISVHYPPPGDPSSGSPPLQSGLDIAEATILGRGQGQPIYSFTGSTGDSGVATIRFWAGPDASRTARAQLAYAVTNIYPDTTLYEDQQLKTSFGFGRIPLGDMDRCPFPWEVSETAVTTGQVADTALKVLEAANGDPARPAELWRLLDRVSKDRFGSFEHFHDLFTQGDLSAGPDERDVYTSWELYPLVIRGDSRGGKLMLDLIRDRCGGQVSEATWITQASFPKFNGVSGGAVQMYFIARRTGPKLWFID